jgi:hypothetical protein
MQAVSYSPKQMPDLCCMKEDFVYNLTLLNVWGNKVKYYMLDESMGNGPS